MGDAAAKSHTSGAAYGRDAEDAPKRQSGIEVVGAIPWGTHFCHFYETDQDLVDTLVPYFRAGLAADEFCMWITSAPLQVEEAKAALRAAVPDLDRRIDDGQIEILDYSDWYARSGEFRADEVLQVWVKKLEAALRRGYEGLRLSGNTFWLGPAAWDDFTSYEEKVNNVIGRHRMLAICTYSLEKCGGLEIADVVADHEFALIKRTGRWQIIESSHHRLTEAALRTSEERFRAMFETSRDLLSVAREDGTTVWANAAWKETLGYAPEGQGDPVEKIHPDDRERVLDAWRAMMAGEGVFANVECRYITTAGGYVHLETTARRIDVGGETLVYVAARDLTDRKRAEEALRESEKRLKRSQQIAHLGSWELDVVNNRLSWSDEAYRIFGLEPQEFGATYEAFLETVHPDDRRAVDAAYSGSLREGRDTYEIQHRVVRKGTGEIRWVQEKCEHVRDESGRIVRSVGMVHDITERKISSRKIADLARFHAENPSPVMRIDARGKLLHANSASDCFLLKWGVKEGESVPQEWRSRVKEALSAGTATSVETESEGRIYALTVAPVEDSGYANLYVTDVTERKAAEEALRRSHEDLEERVRERTAELDQIFHTAASGMRVVDREFTILRANRTLLDMMGLPEEEVVGRKCYEVFRSDRCETPLCPLTRILAGDARVEFDVEKERKDGTLIPCIVTAMPFRAPGGELLGMVEDIWDTTERKRLEAQLLQAQKMEAIGRLAGGIAHDFNNMMQVVTGYAHRMLRELGPDDPERKSVEEIEKAGKRAAALTRQLLALGRRQILQPKVVDINGAVSGIESMLQRTLGDDVDLVMVLQPDVGRVRVDPARLEHIIVNLAINARDAMPGGGRLTVETANVHLGQDYPHDEAAVPPGEYVMIAVKDTGCGMGEETQAQIFDPFFTTKKPGEGTGLGLSTVYGTVRQSGGVIRVYSEPRKGTTFKIYLPRVEDAAQAEISRQPAEEVSGGSETILLVEDDDNVRGLIAVELRERGYTVMEASNGSEAILRGKLYEGQIDLLVTDVMLPGRSGREVYEGVQAVHRGVRVLFISGHTEKHIVHRGVLDPGTCFLEKPFTDDQLAAKVREALGGARTAAG